MENVSLAEDLAVLAQAQGPGPLQDEILGRIDSLQQWGCDAQELLSFAVRLEIGWPRSLALVLKAEEESSVSGGGARRERFSNYGPLRGAATQPYVKNLHRLLSEKFPTDFLLSAEALGNTVAEMRMQNLQRLANDSRELAAYAQMLAKFQQTLADEGDLLGRKFDELRSRQLMLLDELDEILLLSEDRNLRREMTRQEWMRLVGEEFLQLQELISEVEILEAKLRLLEDDPTLSVAELDGLVNDLLRARERELARIRLDLTLVTAGDCDTGIASAISDPQEIARHRQNVKKLLRRLWMLIHPDRLQQHTNYAQLTEKQLFDLGSLWESCMGLQRMDRAATTAMYSRSVATLESAIATAENILEHAGIDVNVELLVQGDTLAEKVAWLEAEVQRLEDDIALAQNELRLQVEDPLTRRMESVINAEQATQESLREAMRSEIEENRSRVDALSQQLAEKLGPESEEAVQ